MAGRSRVNREIHARMCVQQRLVCSVGVSPAGVRIRSSVTIDKAILGVVSELPGRNKSERTGGPESEKPLRPSPHP